MGGFFFFFASHFREASSPSPPPLSRSFEVLTQTKFRFPEGNWLTPLLPFLSRPLTVLLVVAWLSLPVCQRATGMYLPAFLPRPLWTGSDWLVGNLPVRRFGQQWRDRQEN